MCFGHNSGSWDRGWITANVRGSGKEKVLETSITIPHRPQSSIVLCGLGEWKEKVCVFGRAEDHFCWLVRWNFAAKTVPNSDNKATNRSTDFFFVLFSVKDAIFMSFSSWNLQNIAATQRPNQPTPFLIFFFSLFSQSIFLQNKQYPYRKKRKLLL